MSYCENKVMYADGAPLAFADSPSAVITIGKGNTLAEMLSSKDTSVPDGILLFTGADVDRIPHNIAGSKNDLVIYAEDGLILAALSVRYYDVVSDSWVGPITPTMFITNGSFNWGCWRNFANVVVPFKCILTLQGAFVECPDDDDDDDDTTGGDFDGTVDSEIDKDSNNAVSNKAVAEALEAMQDQIDALEDDTEANETLTNKIKDGLLTQGVGYSVVEIEDLNK